MPEYDGILALDRLERAVEKVRDRLLRSTAALEAAGVPYAVIGGNAVMAWVEQVDESAVRFTRDVDIVLRREDLARATAALVAVLQATTAPEVCIDICWCRTEGDPVSEVRLTEDPAHEAPDVSLSPAHRSTLRKD